MKTYTDAILAVIRAIRGHGLVASLDVVKAGVRAGLNNFFLAAHWSRYKKETVVHCQAPQATETANYDSATLMVTLNGSTFPSWAEGCAIVIDGHYGRIAKVISDTTALLSFGPPQSKTGASYVLYNDRVPLPKDAVSVMSIQSQFGQHIRTVSPEWIHANEVCSVVSGLPLAVAVESAANGRYLRFWPYPGSLMSHFIVYRRSPVELLYTGRDEQDYAGTVDVSGIAVTGTGTQFHSNMVGLVFRVSRNNELPTGPDGNNPYAEESLVASVSSSTSLTLQDPLNTYSMRKYCVASLLDVDDWAYGALLAFALDETARLLGADIRTDLAADLDAALAADVSQAQGAVYSKDSPSRVQYIYPIVRS